MSATTADWIYVAALLWPLLCLAYLHAKGRIDLISCITVTKDGKTFVDGKKLSYVGTFAVMATGFAYLLLAGKLTEWYAGLFAGSFILGKFLGDREQRLQKAIDVPKVETPKL